MPKNDPRASYPAHEKQRPGIPMRTEPFAIRGRGPALPLGKSTPPPHSPAQPKAPTPSHRKPPVAASTLPQTTPSSNPENNKQAPVDNADNQTPSPRASQNKDEQEGCFFNPMMEAVSEQKQQNPQLNDKETLKPYESDNESIGNASIVSADLDPQSKRISEMVVNLNREGKKAFFSKVSQDQETLSTKPLSQINNLDSSKNTTKTGNTPQPISSSKSPKVLPQELKGDLLQFDQFSSKFDELVEGNITLQTFLKVTEERNRELEQTLDQKKKEFEQKIAEADRLKTELSCLQLNYNQLLKQQDFTQEKSKNNGQYQKKEQELQTALEKAEQALAEAKAQTETCKAQIEHMLTEQARKTTEQDKALKSLQAQYSEGKVYSESLTQTIETQKATHLKEIKTLQAKIQDLSDQKTDELSHLHHQPMTPTLLARIIIPQEELPVEESPVINHPPTPTSHDLRGQLPFGHLLPIINWIGNHPEQLTRTLAVKVRDLLSQDLGPLTSSSTETDTDLQTCQTQLKQLSEKLNNPLPKSVLFIPRNWTKHPKSPESQTESSLNYAPLDLSHLKDSSKIHKLFLEDTQILSQHAEKGSSKNSLALCLNFSLLSHSSKPYHNPLEEKPKDSKSIQSLAHLLIAHAEIYPNATIEIPETPDAPELITYLRAYETLYKTLGVSLNFNLSSHVSEPTATDITDIISDPEIRAWLSGRNQEEPQSSSYSEGSPALWKLKPSPLSPQSTPFLRRPIS